MLFCSCIILALRNMRNGRRGKLPVAMPGNFRGRNARSIGRSKGGNCPFKKGRCRKHTIRHARVRVQSNPKGGSKNNGKPKN